MKSLIVSLGLLGLALTKKNNPKTSTSTATVEQTGETPNGGEVDTVTETTSNSSINVYSGIFALLCVAFGLSM